MRRRIGERLASVHGQVLVCKDRYDGDAQRGRCHPHAVSRHGAEEEGCCRSTMLRILIADDHAMIRQGLRKLIEEQKDREVCAEASTGSPGRGTHC